MKICLVAEGSYPYVVGGVSSWIHSIINLFPQIEFTLVAILPDRSYRGKFLYELPPNLTGVRELYLQDLEWGTGTGGRVNVKEYGALRDLVMGGDINWGDIFDFFQRERSVNDLLMGPDFLRITKEYSNARHRNVNFADFLWTLRSIYLPLYMTLGFKMPEANLYHCVSTGYAGILGSMGKHLNPGSTLLLSEHGIYTREREEEIIKAKWVRGIYKDIWIEQFQKMSRCAYEYADRVISLFARARELQIELGCPQGKTRVIPNGVDARIFEDIPGKDPDDPYINVGAFLRLAPIKDVKTLINAFHFAQREMPQLKLWIMGPDDEDPQYARECIALVSALKAENIVFTGRVKTTEYMGKMDMTILTSISEGQPLTILESFAAKKPAIATNVGNCQGLVYGEDDDYGAGGMVVPVLNIKEIADGILKLARDEDLRREMGEIGYRRVIEKYRIESFIESYRQVYDELLGGGIKWQE